MKITDVSARPLWCGSRPIKGIDGLGEVESSKPYLKPHVLFYRERILGEDPTDVERVMLKIRNLESFKPWGSAVSAIELAADIGCPRLRVFGGEIPKGVTREQAMDSIIMSLGAVAAQALERGVIICLETHDDWTNPGHVAEIMRQVNHPAVAVTWDVMHPVRQSHVTMDEAFQALRPWIRHVHFHDGLNRLDKFELRPIGEGDFDHRRVVELLMAAGYDGFLSGEWIGWEPYEVHLPRELATMKRYEREIQSHGMP